MARIVHFMDKSKALGLNIGHMTLMKFWYGCKTFIPWTDCI